MFSFSEQISTATKTHFEAQLAMINALTSRTFEGVAKVIELNVNAAKASLEESAVATKQLLSAKDAQEFFTLSATQVQPNAEKVLSYGRHLASIGSSVQADFTKAAEERITEVRNSVTALVNEVTKNAPAGSENAVALLKSTLGNVNAGYDQLTKTTKQAAEALETNLTAVTNQLTQAVEKTVSTKK